MSTNRISLWLKVHDTARWRRDLRDAAADVREVGEASNYTQGRVSGMVDTFKEWANNIPQWSGRTRIFGFAIGTVLTALVAIIPVVVGLGGAIVALAGSFSAAAIGAGLLATALTGVLAAGLGSVGLVAFDAIQNFQEVNTRFNTWRDAVSAFGKDSEQANTAFKRLMGSVANNGGPLILEAVQAFHELRKEFQEAMQPVTQKLMMGMLALFQAIRKLLPVFSRFVSIVVDALGPVLQAFIDYFTGREFQNSFIAIGSAFAQIIGPIGIGVLWFFQGLMRLVVRMLPYLLPVARGFQTIAENFAVWARTADLSPFLSHLQSWYGLLKATGGLLITILSGGAGAGQGLVDSLTNVFKKWDSFLKSAEGQGKMASFFADAAEMTKAFAGFIAWLTGLIFKFGRWALPAYTKFFQGAVSIFHQFLDALKPAKPFWDNVLWPLISNIAKAVGATLAGAFKFIIGLVKIFASALGVLGKWLAPLKGFFGVLGYVIGFVFGGPILKGLSLIGKLSILLKPLGFMFKLLYQPIRLVGAVVGWVFTRFAALAEILGRTAGYYLPVLRRVWGRILGFLTGLGQRFYDAGVRIWMRLREGFFQAVGAGLGFVGDLAKAFANAVIGFLNSAIPNSLPVPGPLPNIDLPNNPIPMLAAGGVVSGSGSWITGEAGPELNTLRGGRVTVQPLPAISAPAQGVATLDPARGREVRVTKIYLRGKQIAEAVADEAEDEAARM